MADREGTIQRQGFIHLSGAASSRKEKKKQVKEERDRLKQAEKKKRRLEKALANAAAIRSELEKKKQKRKEEEQRLDKEGAALAEAVALQVLVDEESDVPGMLKMKPSTGVDTVLKETWSTGVDTVLKETCNSAMADMRGTGHGTLLELERRELGYENGPGCTESFRQIATRESAGSINHREMLWRNLWKQSDTSVEISRRAELESKEILFEWDKAGFHKKIIISNEEMARKGSDRAKVAEMAAGSAAAQAVAALRIAEEAKAEAEAAKKAAEVAMNEALDRNELQHKPHLIEHENIQGKSIEKERDELKARLEFTERKLKEKTRQVSELEHDLEEVTQFLMEFKAMVERSKEESDFFVERQNGRVAIPVMIYQPPSHLVGQLTSEYIPLK